LDCICAARARIELLVAIGYPAVRGATQSVAAARAMVARLIRHRGRMRDATWPHPSVLSGTSATDAWPVRADWMNAMCRRRAAVGGRRLRSNASFAVSTGGGS